MTTSEPLPPAPCSAHLDALKANFMRHLYLKMRIIQHKQEITELESQWADISDDLRGADFDTWVNFHYSLDRSKPNIQSLYQEWEDSHPDWMVSGSSVRRRKATIKDSLTVRKQPAPNAAGETRRP